MNPKRLTVDFSNLLSFLLFWEYMNVWTQVTPYRLIRALEFRLLRSTNKLTITYIDTKIQPIKPAPKVLSNCISFRVRIKVREMMAASERYPRQDVTYTLPFLLHLVQPQKGFGRVLTNNRQPEVEPSEKITETSDSHVTMGDIPPIRCALGLFNSANRISDLLSIQDHTDGGDNSSGTIGAYKSKR